MKKCVFAGTFDPPTIGHESVVNDCLKIFDSVVVAILENTQKHTLLTLDERLALLNKLFCGNPNVKVISFSGAVVDLLERENTPFYVRGIRNTIDFEYENSNTFANKKLKSDIVTIYIPAEQDKLQISSTLVRNSAHFKKNYGEYLPQKISADILALLDKKQN
jgi:pantetheine-phosphate adenylyltransferase